MGSRSRMLAKAAVVMAVLVAIHATVGFLLVPWLAQRYLPQAIEQKLGREITVGEFEADPFLLTFEAHRVAVQGDEVETMVAIERLFVDLSPWSLLRGVWTLDEVIVEGLEAHAVLHPDGALNFMQVARHWRDEGAPEGDVPKVRVGRLELRDGALTLTDLRRSDAEMVVHPIDAKASDLSTFAKDQAGMYALAAALPGGGSLELGGTLSLQPALAASGSIELQGLQARKLLPFLDQYLHLSELQARVDFAARYAIAGDGPLRLEGIGLGASDVRVTAEGAEEPMLSSRRLTARGAAVDIGERTARVDSLVFADGRVRLAVARDGSMNWTRIFSAEHGDRAQPASAAAWQVEVPSLRFEQMEVAYLQQNDAGPRAAETAATRPALEIGSIDGQLSLAMELGGRQTQVVASGIQAQVKQATIPGRADQVSGFRVSSGRVTGGRLDLAARRIGAALVEVDGAATLVRNARGELALPPLIAPRSEAAEDAGSATAAWRYRFEQVRAGTVAVRLVDRTVRPPLALSGLLQGSATSLASDKPASFEVGLRLEQGGTVDAKGTMSPAAAQVSARVEASAIALQPFQPLLARIAALEVASGAASADARVLYERGGDLRAEGSFGLSRVRVNEAGSDDRFLSWHQLDARGVVFDLGARQFTVDEVDLMQPGAKVVISEDRDLNLVQVLERDDDPGNASGQTQRSDFEFLVRRVRLRQGEVDFADLSLVLPFSTTIKGLEGTIVDVSSDPARRAGVKAEGSVEPYGSARVEGTLVPVAPTRLTDLRVEFDNILVPPLSPYTATFAGRKVQSGRLWLDLHYRIEDGELLGRNEIRLQDFRLGERVEAPDAWDVPLDLVIALLTDSDGDIHLSVPVTGELGSARFSVASAVRQALGNVLQRIVSAPFRALASVLGTNESLASIDFSPGSSRLRPQEIEKLDALARAMRERPRIRLVVEGPYHPQLDASSLQREQARRALAQALGREPGPQEEPGPVAYDDPTTRRALRRMLSAVAGDDAVRQLEARFGGEAQGLYEAMFDRITAAQQLSDTGVQLLAAERAREIAEYLRQRGIDDSRVQTGRLASVRAQQGGGVSSQLQIAAAPVRGN